MPCELQAQNFGFQWQCWPNLPESSKLQSPLFSRCSPRRSLEGPWPLLYLADQRMHTHAERQQAQCRPCRPLFRLAIQYRRLKTHLAISWLGMVIFFLIFYFFKHLRQMTFGKHRLVKVKPFRKTTGTLPLQTPQNPKVEEKEMENEPSSGWWWGENYQ